MRLKIICTILFIFCIISCSKDKDKPNPDNGGDNNITEIPEAANLLQPKNNKICVEGKIYSEKISGITFKWEKSAHTDRYKVVVKNLKSNKEESKSTTGLSLSINLERNTPYSWYVISQSNNSEKSTKSKVWRFYNEGEGEINHVPFPAGNLTPSMDEVIGVGSGIVELSWEGADVDDDILNYDVYLGKNQDQLKMIRSEIRKESISDVSVDPNTKYFWKVVTNDKEGNSSVTRAYHFSTK